MIRGYLTFIVVLGVFTSVAGGMISPPESAGSQSATSLVDHGALDERPDRRSGRSDTVISDGAVRLERQSNGHFYADVVINGASVNMLVDTGASGIALSREDARKAGVATSIGMPNVVGKGADGDVRGEFVELSTVSLGHRTAEGMGAMVLNSGELSLLGQDFLSKFESVEIRGDTMVLR